MCPACFTSAALVITGAISAGGLTALIAKVRAKNGFKKASQNPNPKEETWEK